MKTLLEVIKLNKSNIGKIKIGSQMDFVDLGLPSKTLWANCNLGASNPADPGDCYQWGDIIPRKPGYGTWDNYKFGTKDNIAKYNDQDHLNELEPEDDVVTQTLGTKYKIPSVQDFYELRNNTVQIFTKNYNNTNVSGLIIFKSKKEYNNDEGKYFFNPIPDKYNENIDTHIFIPVDKTNNKIHLYSNTILPQAADIVFQAEITKSDFCPYSTGLRYEAQYIRPIKIK